MKHIVSDHARAIGSPINFVDNNGIGKGEVQMYQCGNTGLIFAVDGAWLEDQDEEKPLAIPSFVDQGTAIVLVDSEKEINYNLKSVGDEHSDEIIDKVIEKMKADISQGDLTAIAEMLNFVSEEVLDNYVK